MGTSLYAQFLVLTNIQRVLAPILAIPEAYTVIIDVGAPTFPP